MWQDGKNSDCSLVAAVLILLQVCQRQMLRVYVNLKNHMHKSNPITQSEFSLQDSEFKGSSFTINFQELLTRSHIHLWQHVVFALDIKNDIIIT
jgi:hypothetical protein